jgi:hypothetical protein
MKVGPAVPFALCVAAALSACSDGASTSSPIAPKSAHAHSTFAGCEEFREYYARAVAREVLVGGCWGCVPGGGVIGGSAGGDGSVGAVPDPLTVSQTNTQEAGVDEDDIIEADPDTGRFYVLQRYGRPREVLAVRAVPAETMAIASRTGLGELHAEGMYLDSTADRLVVVGTRRDNGVWAGERSTQVLFYDVSDPDHPELTDRYEIDGWLLGSRRIGGRLHLVTSSWGGAPPGLWTPEYLELLYGYHQARVDRNWVRAAQLAPELRARIVAAVNAAPIEGLLPAWRRGLDPAAASTPLDCSVISRPELDERPGIVTITSIDTDGGGLAHIGAINNSWRIYASAEHLYLLQGSGGWWWAESQPQQTAIYRYRVGDDGPARPAGHGVVDGWVYDSYGLSEHEGHLRVATTDTDPRRRAPDGGPWQTNHMYVLGEARGEPLEVVGQVRDFMVNESIHAARFIGDRGFVITFRFVDPLFTFDLSDPQAPQQVGELEVPGVSTYLHPYGADQLIGVGRRADPFGAWRSDLQLQLFDVSTLAAPQVLDTELIGEPEQWSWSIAAVEPHALTLFGTVLSVPVSISSGNHYDALSGFLVYRMAPASGFTPIGRVDHKQEDDGTGTGCPPVTDGSQPPCSTFAPVRFTHPLRSVVLEETSGRTVLYTLSDAFLKGDAVGDTLTPIRSVPLAE